MADQQVSGRPSTPAHSTPLPGPSSSSNATQKTLPSFTLRCVKNGSPAVVAKRIAFSQVRLCSFVKTTSLAGALIANEDVYRRDENGPKQFCLRRHRTRHAAVNHADGFSSGVRYRQSQTLEGLKIGSRSGVKFRRRLTYECARCHRQARDSSSPDGKIICRSSDARLQSRSAGPPPFSSRNAATHGRNQAKRRMPRASSSFSLQMYAASRFGLAPDRVSIITSSPH
jgi:hypothetical protein